ncbi:unnamed protein product [Urochloa decumbens]|uniref:F-box domain-containing protein n=1 Tax=Urochloa decumbens TaxID=240449 RepID=A0ABC9EMU9_9POAL
MGRAAQRSASRRRIRARQGTEETSFRRLPPDSITDIFLRLPAKSILRCRAVSKEWRSFTTNPSFVAAHARLQPAQVVLYKYLDTGPYEVALDVVPFSDDGDNADAQRRLIRYPRTRSMLLLASCNGVLLFSKPDNGNFLLCNPATWQWAELPRLPEALRVAGVGEYQYAFYFHEPSNEFRILLRRGHSWPRASSWHILSTGAAEPRRVAAMLPPGASITSNSLMTALPVALNGRLHWPPRVVAATAAGASTTMTVTTEMVVFDTVAETFGRMAGPPTVTAELVKLFDIEGRLVAADFGEEEHVDLWFLEDYGAGRWERRHRVATAWAPRWLAGVERGPPREAADLVCVAAAGDGEGNVMLGSHIWLAVYNLRTRTTRTVASVGPGRNMLVSRHVFSESLVRHPAFAARSAADLGVTFSWC